MAFLRKTDSKSGGKPENAADIQKAENGWSDSKKRINDAIYELGKAYFEANKENAESDFAGYIEKINKSMKEEYIWHQYRLSLEGQRLCDKCGSTITADSAFCNRCGAAVSPIDFSPVIGTSNVLQPETASGQVLTCPKCGRKIIEGAIYCEGCGTKVV